MRIYIVQGESGRIYMVTHYFSVADDTMISLNHCFMEKCYLVTWQNGKRVSEEELKD